MTLSMATTEGAKPPAPPTVGTDALLEVQGLEVAYGASQVLFGVDLWVPAGGGATLLGRNGMGKTTTVKALLGLLQPLAGRIRFRGERIDGLPPDRIARMGLAVVPEGRQVFPNLSVRENLVAFAANRRASDQPWTLDGVLHLFPRLGERLNHMGNQLSGGEQQMLAIGRALMTNPHLLILDEATEGLAPLVREDIWHCLATLRAQGQTIVVIDKYLQRLLPLASHHTILEKGRVAWAGDSASLAAQPELWHRYLGV
jgi:branched-chain amino acid transport system ATP-binding protein